MKENYELEFVNFKGKASATLSPLPSVSHKILLKFVALLQADGHTAAVMERVRAMNPSCHLQCYI